jgi:hypothetical protein
MSYKLSQTAFVNTFASMLCEKFHEGYAKVPVGAVYFTKEQLQVPIAVCIAFRRRFKPLGMCDTLELQGCLTAGLFDSHAHSVSSVS